ncbi:RNA polymerase sigma factor [Aliikangiella coralliicola]|uniref:Sigma-70 family RNA polymerase sigma factor n=1 Tax=Aliikangiella coralliicola TaxID=2592383 RepID=A0A545UG46_9GAMM|nr:sigma-70 family RNA polymerase sigma factor [Aliikangiella coralliicola]TQV88439.1 sigma-70 family RNA polymerase sigma factor [Aliikangiella coralliicola]
MESIEKDLIEAAQQGNVSAFEQLINGTERKMLSIAAGFAASPDDAEDIYQDAMINAFRALPKFRKDSQFSTWLYRILVNTAISSRRKLKSKINRLITFYDPQNDENTSISGYEQYGSESNPEAQLSNDQLSKAINKALASLSDKEKIAFVLCHQQEIKIVDAAQIMGCGEGSVKSYLFRARDKMRSQLQSFIG